MKITYAVSIFVFFSHLILNSMEKECVQGEQNIKIIPKKSIISLYNDANKIFVKSVADCGERLLTLLHKVETITQLYEIDRKQLTNQVVSFAITRAENPYLLYDARPRIAALFICINTYLDQLAQNNKQILTISEYNRIKNDIKIVKAADNCDKEVVAFHGLVQDIYRMRIGGSAALDHLAAHVVSFSKQAKL